MLGRLVRAADRHTARQEGPGSETQSLVAVAARCRTVPAAAVARCRTVRGVRLAAFPLAEVGAAFRPLAAQAEVYPRLEALRTARLTVAEAA